jgi:hypothetical protein
MLGQRLVTLLREKNSPGVDLIFDCRCLDHLLDVSKWPHERHLFSVVSYFTDTNCADIIKQLALQIREQLSIYIEQYLSSDYHSVVVVAHFEPAVTKDREGEYELKIGCHWAHLKFPVSRATPEVRCHQWRQTNALPLLPESYDELVSMCDETELVVYSLNK